MGLKVREVEDGLLLAVNQVLASESEDYGSFACNKHRQGINDRVHKMHDHLDAIRDYHLDEMKKHGASDEELSSLHDKFTGVAQALHSASGKMNEFIK